MKELRAYQSNPQYGDMNVILRFRGHVFFVKKAGENAQVNQMIDKLRSGGASIFESRKWLRVNMFNQGNIYRLGGREFDITKLGPTEVEEILIDFYKQKYTEGKYVVTVTEVSEDE